jgi:hypothetical protein
MPMRIAVLQPSYLPWLGYFDQIARVDAFVFYDDVQYDRDGWRNRNRIKTTGPEGWQWLTVPVLLKGKHGAAIRDVQINNADTWKRKHLAAIGQWYRRAPFRDAVMPLFTELLEAEWSGLSDLCIEAVRRISAYLGIRTSFHRSSELGVEGDRVERLVKLCAHFQADEYLSGDSAENYIKPEAFSERGIRVMYQRYSHPVYPQLYGDFVSHLSIVDLLFNVGPDSLRTLCNEAARLPVRS